MKNVESEQRKQAFETIYDSCYWGGGNLSGAGSSLEATKTTREIVLNIINDYKINSIVDVACGDFVWMPSVLDECGDEVKYTGCDIVESLVVQHEERYPQYNFQALDFVDDAIPEGELIICREALQHLPVKDIKRALHNFSNSGSKYLLATTHLRRHGIRNRLDIRPGRCRDRNLLLAPFNLPDPLVIYSEQLDGKDKFFGLWKIPF